VEVPDPEEVEALICHRCLLRLEKAPPVVAQALLERFVRGLSFDPVEVRRVLERVRATGKPVFRR